MRDNRIFAAQLSRARGDRTQAQLAQLLGVTVQTISNWENGRSVPRGKGRTDDVLSRAGGAADRRRELMTNLAG